MPRNDPNDIKDIIDTELADSRITAFILAASQVIDKLLIKDFDEPMLKEIERWLSAHYIAATIDRQAIHEKAGPAEQKFADIFGKNLEATTYGQTVLTLDSTGKLKRLGQKQVVFKTITEA